MLPSFPSSFISHVLTLTAFSKGEKVTIPAHSGEIDIQGIAVAKVDSAVRLQAVEIFYDPLEMFRQIAKKSNVKKTKLSTESKDDLTTLLYGDGYAVEKPDASVPFTSCPFLPAENKE